jgi:predicted site-specific integrase-resolvase
MHWKKKNIIAVKIKSQNKILYNVAPHLTQSYAIKKIHVVYARVSTPKQNKDLHAQAGRVKNWCMNSFGVAESDITTLTDIGSGMSAERPALKKLMELVKAGSVQTIYISYKDRLSRFGFGYLANMFSLFGVDIKILDNDSKQKTTTEELNEDLISIIHHFSAKMYSNRKKFVKIDDK